MLCVTDFEKIHTQTKYLFVESKCKQSCIYLSLVFWSLAGFISTNNILKRFNQYLRITKKLQAFQI